MNFCSAHHRADEAPTCHDNGQDLVVAETVLHDLKQDLQRLNQNFLKKMYKQDVKPCTAQIELNGHFYQVPSFVGAGKPATADDVFTILDPPEPNRTRDDNEWETSSDEESEDIWGSADNWESEDGQDDNNQYDEDGGYQEGYSPPDRTLEDEATAGTVMFIDIPNHRQDLWKRFHADNYPVWSYRRGDGEDYYQGGGFPISKEGRLKFGFRGRKFTNFQPHPTHPDLRISTPRTRYTADRINTVPLYGLSRMKEVITQAFPELAEFNFTDSRLCWYTDSIDNDYVIDYVPGYSDSLFICTGGSGHAFKFLPVLGKHVKNQLERLPDQFTSAWKWRVAEQGKPNNGLSEGEDGPREMSKLEMASARDFKLKQAPFQKL